MSRAHPKTTPLSEWPDGWLVLEVASRLDAPGYIAMSDSERAARGYPASREQRLRFVEGDGRVLP